MFNVWRSFHRNGTSKAQNAPAQTEDAQPNEVIDKRVQKPPVVQTTVPPRRVNSYGQRGSRSFRGRGRYASQDVNRRHESARASSGSRYDLRARPSGSFPARSSQIDASSKQPLSPGAPPTSTQSLSPAFFVSSPICQRPRSPQLKAMAGAEPSVEKFDTETAMAPTSGRPVKDERSPSPDLASQSKPITSGSRLYAPVPPECQKSRPGHKACREAWARREADELRRLGLKVVRQFIREDGMVIDWESTHPVMSDTLKPDPHNLGAVIQRVHGHNHVASEGHVSKKRKLRPTSQSPSAGRGTSVADPICIDEAPPTVEINQSAPAAKSRSPTSLGSQDGEEAGSANSSRDASIQQTIPGQRADSGNNLRSGGLIGSIRTPTPASTSNHAASSLTSSEVRTHPQSSQKPTTSHSPDASPTRSPFRAVSMLNERMKRRRLSNALSNGVSGTSCSLGVPSTHGPTSPPSRNREELSRPHSDPHENGFAEHSSEGSLQKTVAEHTDNDASPARSPAAKVPTMSEAPGTDQAAVADYPTEDEADELSAAALEYMQQYIEAFDNDRSSLASAFSRDATFSCRLKHVHTSADSTDQRVQIGRLDVVSELLSLSDMKFCPEGSIDLQYDVASLENHIGVLCVAQGTLQSPEACGAAGMPFTLNFVLRRKTHDSEDESTDALWPLIAVAHQMIVWNVP